MPELTPETLFAILENLPSARSIERESGLSQGYLSKIKAGEKKLSSKTIAKLEPVLRKYKLLP